jgi:predicted unusual protein kinase regulating ubiquinone biosynthesis (AarF/ABC1/UbiB family)
LKEHRNQLLSDPLLFDAYVGFLVEMHDKGFMHGDQNLSNILFWKEGQAYRFEVIDINRSHFISNPTRDDCLKNLMRITRDRDFSRKVVERYADMRQWDKSSCVDFVFKKIDKYERKRKMRKFYHKIFPKK